MIYIEHCLRTAGIRSLSTVSILVPPGAERTSGELGDELRDMFPDVCVHEGTADSAPRACDLLIGVFSDPHRFPLHDVIYEHLDACDALLAHARHAQHVMLYRASWRGAEIVPAARLRARVRRLRIEGRLIDLARGSRVIRWLLRPQYGQGN